VKRKLKGKGINVAIEKPHDTRTGTYAEDPKTGKMKDFDPAKAQDYNEVNREVKTKEDYDKQVKEAQKFREESDKRFQNLLKENAEVLQFEGDDDLKGLADKLQKAIERFQNAKQAAMYFDDPNIEGIRELRTKTFGQVQNILSEIRRRVDILVRETY